VLWRMALESANGRQKHHTQAGLHVCCERALKSASERTTHGGAGSVRGPSGNRPRDRSNTSGNRGEGGAAWHRWWRFGCAALCFAGKLLTGNIGPLCEQQPLKALRAPCGSIPQYQYKILVHLYLIRTPLSKRGARANRFGHGFFRS
jgi:hypothetical protein